MKRLFPLLCCLGALLASGGLSHGLTIPASEDTAGAAQITTTANGAASLSVDASNKATESVFPKWATAPLHAQ